MKKVLIKQKYKKKFEVSLTELWTSNMYMNVPLCFDDPYIKDIIDWLDRNIQHYTLEYKNITSRGADIQAFVIRDEVFKYSSIIIKFDTIGDALLFKMKFID